ncbi:MAG: 3-deoxy-D-manno-octulosonic acid transferase [Acidobacteriota bacterium]
MFFLYSLILSIGFLVMLPLFILRREKYASGFFERLGKYPEFSRDGGPVIWLQCVSVGETNAALPLFDILHKRFPGHRLIISTTTRTGQRVARDLFGKKAAAVFYFPFDWKFSVKRALSNYQPSLVLLLETEIWPRFIHETKNNGSLIAIVNGRLSERSYKGYSRFRSFVSRALLDLDLTAMQGEKDAERIASLGMPADRIRVTGNIKFDQQSKTDGHDISREVGDRFGISKERPLIIAASTHEPEERWILDAYCSLAPGETTNRPRLMIAPRHPERFDEVATAIRDFRNDPACEWKDYRLVRRSADARDDDGSADIILLDSIGELRDLYSLAEIVFVGGSLIPHGGQSVLEPAAAGKAIVTGPYTHNFADSITMFKRSDALVQLDKTPAGSIPDDLFLAFSDLLEDKNGRDELGQLAAGVMAANRGAASLTADIVEELLQKQ